MQNETFILREGHWVISARCVEIFAKLTHMERNALSAIAAGQVGTVSIAELAKLKSLDLIHHDGSSITLTGKGREIADLC